MSPFLIFQSKGGYLLFGKVGAFYQLVCDCSLRCFCGVVDTAGSTALAPAPAAAQAEERPMEGEAPAPPRVLSADQVEAFDRDGFLVIERFWSEETVERLRDRMGAIIDELDVESAQAPRSVFSTKEQVRKADDYFLTSGREIRFFWEEKAWGEDGRLVNAPRDSINKVGHGLHDLDVEFEAVSYEKRIGRICRELGLEIPLAVQSMYIFKQARVGGEVGAHQDGAFLYTEPQTCIGFWWPLDDCRVDNGCLWAVPGSHKLGVHRRFRRRDPPNEGTEFEPLAVVEWDLTGAVALEIPKGSLVILHAAVVHYSEGNTSSNPRHAYSIHVIDGKAGVEYPRDNWLQRPSGHPFRQIE